MASQCPLEVSAGLNFTIRATPDQLGHSRSTLALGNLVFPAFARHS
jgi:hypothetical protein